MNLSEVITQWRDFYGAVAGTGAALVGLVYVGVSIHVGRRPLDKRSRLLATMSGVNLLHPTLAGLIMLMPVAPRMQGAVLVLLATMSLGASLSIAIAETRQPEGQARQLIAFRYFIPILAAAMLTLGAFGMVVGDERSIYAVALFVFLMFAVGVDNAWDLQLDRYTKRSVIDIKTPPTTSAL